MLIVHDEFMRCFMVTLLRSGSDMNYGKLIFNVGVGTYNFFWANKNQVNIMANDDDDDRVRINIMVQNRKM